MENIKLIIVIIGIAAIVAGFVVELFVKKEFNSAGWALVSLVWAVNYLISLI
jgi:hypothetical protein